MKLLRILKIFAIVIVSLLILMLSTALVIVYFYEDEVKQLLVVEINKQLVTPIKVEKIELSLIKKFPNASLVFSNVSANSVQPNDSAKTTKAFEEKLFDAGRIFLQFNIMDIFHRQYHIKRIDLEDVKLNLLNNSEGIDNYHFWKKSADTTASPFQLQLEKIVVQNAEVMYRNEKDDQLYSLIVKESHLVGNFSESKYNLDIEGDYYVDEITLLKTTYVKRKSVRMKGMLEVEKNENYQLKEVEILVNDLAFALQGNIIVLPEKNHLDLAIKGKNLDVQTLISLLPDTYRKKLNSYSSSGNFYFDASIKGDVSSKSNPLVVANFGIKQGEIEEGISGLNLEHIALVGRYSNGSARNSASSELQIQQFNAGLGQGKLMGNCKLKNFDNPYLNLVAEAELNLNQVKQFLKLDTLEECEGQLRLDLDFSGNTKHMKHFSGKDFAQTKTQGTLTIERGTIKLTGAKQRFENINASLLFNNNDIVVNECNGKIQDSDFALKGFFRNALAALINPEEKLNIEAGLSSKFIDLNQILASNDAPGKKQSDYELRFSDRINFNLNVAIGKLIFQRFEATSIKGTALLQEKKLALNPLSFNTMDGAVLASGVIDNTSADGFKTICTVDMHSINISKLFYTFENFGGTTLTDKHLKGTATAGIQFSGNFSSSLAANTESMVAKGDISIDNGELNNFEPMRKLSRFIALSELNNIRFSSLKNTIEVKNRKVIIPNMEIKNSALNLSLAGTHSFDNVVDYHFKLLLNELLGKKARKAKQENEEYGSIEDDGLGIGKTAIYISMVGSLDNPKITYDRSGLKLQMKQNVSDEKRNLKSILKSEFGWFKNDSTVKVPSAKKHHARFDTEWEEDDKKSTQKSGEKQLPKVKAPVAKEEEKKSIKVLDKLFKKEEEKPKKKKEKADKTENSDDFN